MCKYIHHWIYVFELLRATSKNLADSIWSADLQFDTYGIECPINRTDKLCGRKQETVKNTHTIKIYY